MDEIVRNPEWYIGVPYSEKKVIIGDNFNSMTRDYISSGYFLRDINEHKEYLEDGFSDIYEFAEHTYGLKKSSVNHCMRINAAFSKNGNSPILDEKYKGFGRSQLQELLYVPEEKWEEISPQMTVKEIREVGKHRLDIEPESEQVDGQMAESDCPEHLPEAHKKILPIERGCITGKNPYGNCVCCGSGEVECCAQCKSDCNSRCEWLDVPERRDSEKTEAVTENVETDTDQENAVIYPATLQEYAAQAATLEGVPEPDEEWNIGDLLQAKEKYLKRLARILVKESPSLRGGVTDYSVRRDMEKLGSKYKQGIDIGDGVKAWPCEEIIEFGAGENGEEELGVCSYDRFLTQVRKATDEWDDEKSESVEKKSQIQETCGDNEAEDTRTEETIPLSDLEIAKEKLEKEIKMLADMLEYFTENDFRVRNQKIVVAALTAYAADLDNALNPLPETEQPELPIMRNDEQRKEWLRNYQSWGLWYEDEHIGAKFYKYEFENGATLIAEEYSSEKTGYYPEIVSCYLHLIGGPEPKKNPKTE